MEETKLIKLLDLALERIEALESDENLEIIERENEAFRRTIEELEKDRSELQNYFDKANAEASELLNEVNQLNERIDDKDGVIFELHCKLEELSKQRNELVLETANAGEVAQIKKENEEDKLEELAKNSGESTPAKWNDILDATKRPKVDERVLITTNTGRVIVGSFDEVGKFHTQGKTVQATAWMKLPKPFTN